MKRKPLAIHVHFERITVEESWRVGEANIAAVAKATKYRTRPHHEFFDFVAFHDASRVSRKAGELAFVHCDQCRQLRIWFDLVEMPVPDIPIVVAALIRTLLG